MLDNFQRKVAIIGASINQERYSNKAVRKLKDTGYDVIPVNPNYSSIYGLNCFSSVSRVSSEIETISIYVRPNILISLAKEIIDKQPSRIIFNPGSEEGNLARQFEECNIEVLQACTLALLATNQF